MCIENTVVVMQCNGNDYYNAFQALLNVHKSPTQYFAPFFWNLPTSGPTDLN